MIASIIFGRQPVIIIGDLLVVNRLRFGLPVNRRARSLDRRQMDVTCHKGKSFVTLIYNKFYYISICAISE